MKKSSHTVIVGAVLGATGGYIAAKKKDTHGELISAKADQTINAAMGAVLGALLGWAFR